MKKVKSVALDASLLAEAEKEAEGRGITFSALVGEALRRLLRQAGAWRGVEEKLANIETLLRQCLQKEARPAESRGQSSRQEPSPQLGDNLWISILRKWG